MARENMEMGGPAMRCRSATRLSMRLLKWADFPHKDAALQQKHLPSIVMALSLFAAQAVLGHYLNGRVLPLSLHSSLVHSVEARFIDGKSPVLDEELCKTIDGAASEFRAEAELSNT